MTWFGWLFIAVLILSVASSILTIGKPRQPISSGLALTTTAINAGLIVATLMVGTGHL